MNPQSSPAKAAAAMSFMDGKMEVNTARNAVEFNDQRGFKK